MKGPRIIYDDFTKQIKTYHWLKILSGLSFMGWVITKVEPYPPSHHVDEPLHIEVEG